jgi:hypothetical protein
MAAKIFIPLSQETRPTVSTAAAASYLHLKPQTLHKNACLGRGPLRPRRLPGSSKLHWVTDEIRVLLGVSK